VFTRQVLHGGTAFPGKNPRMADNETNLEGLLDELADASEKDDQISVVDIQDMVGHRSFAPLLAILGLIVMTPVGGIPGAPTMFGIIVILVAGQILLGQRTLWLPSGIRERSVPADKLKAGTEKIRPMARRVDRVFRPRWTFLTEGPALYAIALACVLLGAMLPPLELIPMGAVVPAIAVTMFALALMANDGFMALLGYIVCAVAVYLIAAVVPFAAIF
tara:strand:- start:211 stop:867 length:657 start_codon:yes stop_codon:yes gene_type:complete